MIQSGWEKIMQLKNLLSETPILIPSIKKDESALSNITLEKQKKYFESLIGKSGEWETKVRKATLKKVKNSYILFSNNNELLYGLKFEKFNDGITISWMENYSNLRGLTVNIFTSILKFDPSVKEIYSGSQHTPENKRLHMNLKKFKNLNIDIFDDSKKEITFENPYVGFNRGYKQFRFSLKKS